MASRRLLVSLAATGVVASMAAAGSPGAAAKPQASPPDKVLIIVVDALSKEIVDKYHMKNVEKLMAQGVDTPNGYLGHTGSVTVVTHNVLTTGMQPKHMGWTNEGYRDVDGLLGPQGGLYLTSNFGAAQMAPLQRAAGAPHLSDYLDDTGKVFTVSPKSYAAYGLGGPGSDRTSVLTFGSKTCPVPGSTTGETKRFRAPTGLNVPAYFSADCGSRWVVARDTIYDTGQLPASLYPATDDRYVVGTDPAHQGGDIWATDAVLEIMDQEQDDWSGIFVSLPGVDKAAHMWGGVNDPESATPGYNPMTHMKYAAATADAQVGRIMDALKRERRARQHARRADRRPRVGRGRTRPLPRHPRRRERLRLQQLVLRGPASTTSSTTSRSRPCSRSWPPATSGSPTATPRSTSGSRARRRPRSVRPPRS